MSAARAIVAAVGVAIFLMAAAVAFGAAYEDTANEQRVTNESFTVNGSQVPYNVTLNQSARDDAIYDTAQFQDPTVVNEDTNTTMSSPDDYIFNANGSGKLWIPSGSELDNGTNTTNATADYSYGTWTHGEQRLLSLMQVPLTLAPFLVIALFVGGVLLSLTTLGGGL